MSEKTIWTIGHSTHPLEEFMAMLKSFDIELVADIRRFPGSKRHPHFSRESLETSLPESGIAYRHFEALGGRRRTSADSKNTGWRLPAFRGYADYMETAEFQRAAQELEKIALKKRVAYMCSEAVWWSCHRSLVSDFLKVRGWEVLHIMGIEKSQEHPYTSPAKVIDGKLDYGEDQMKLL
jgi:uncharacterized protein (DUF488 family)